MIGPVGSRVVSLAIAVVAGATGCRQIFGIDDTTVADDDGDDAPPADAVMIDASPACIDGVLSPGEADVDCGGVCPNGCDAGDDCTMHTDCASSVCANLTCAVLASCLAIRDAGQTTSGIYPLDPDGLGAQPPFDAYCQQTMAGGGWTLVMKLSSTDDELANDAPHWTTPLLLAATDLAPNVAPQGVNAKLAAFNAVAGTELRLEWRDPADHAFPYAIPLPARTALAVFQGGEHLVDGDEGNNCNGNVLTGAPGYLATHMRHGRASQFSGINGTDADESIRFGFASNDEPANAWFPYQGAGTTTRSLQWTNHTDCNNCGCFGSEYDPAVTSANLWIR
jgi:hypothetical protein